MKKIIIIKYGELTTKKDNINFFIKTLRDNITLALEGIEHNNIYDKGRMFIETDCFDEVTNILIKTFGIHEINIGYKIDYTDIEEIGSKLLDLLKDKKFNTFKVETKRSNKNYPSTSMEVNSKLGAFILKNIANVKVDVHNPELEINIEIRYKDIYIYFAKIPGIGGYPVGTLGKGMLMLSGGIDSPVAGYLALKRGIRLECIYFESPPHTSENAKNKVLNLAKVLSEYSGYVKVHVIRFTEIQEAIYKNIPKEYMITIMRRMMYRISEKMAHRNNCKAIINGESVGQVASQTLTSMSVINEVITMPVLRPVACFDKNEIIKLSKSINTYDISIEPYEDCCTIFVPDHPVINPESCKALEYEKLISYEELIKEAIRNVETIKVTPKMQKYSNIL
ncbi:MAG: tRNA 4-thiouridine(8) synthase ThiI [Mollicutes bacterium]|jgi:thiamine biosynthesis protein ThiI|nr:tRNA 4-thiouridine(8) synthase ThiI [Mollicutes bacterium]